MRALFVNGRPDDRQTPGGDTVQVSKTKAALEALGVEVGQRSPGDVDDLSPYDVAEVFNIQTPDTAWAAVERIMAQGIPVVLAPIFWELYGHWFELAVVERAQWRKLARVFGKRRTRQFYVAWQRRKAPSTAIWQTQRRLLMAARRVAPNSESELDLLQDAFGLGADFRQKVDVVPNAIDVELYRTLPAPDEAFARQHGVRDFVLQVGTLNPVKNQLGLIEALFDLPTPIVFIGQTPEAWAGYARACRERGAEKGNVLFLDRIPHERLPGIYALAAVHVLPSWRETPGLVSLEAAAAGCKVVTTSVGSARDYFGDRAWYCAPDDRNSIRSAVEAALHAPSSAAVLREHVLTHYTWEKTAEATLASFRKAVSR